MSQGEYNLSDDASANPHEEVAALAALLRWYEAVGADEAIGETPRDHFAEFARPKPEPAPARLADSRPASDAPRTAPPHFSDAPPPPARVRPDMSAAHMSPDAAVTEAERLAMSAQTLEDLRAGLERFEGCSLRKSAQKLVFGEGAQNPRILVMGETPDRDDDNSGRPFSGLRGLLLERMLRAIGIERNATYLTQIVPWFPPGNAMPAKHHIEACLPFARRHIELAEPVSMICLGWAAEKLGVEKGAPSDAGLTSFVVSGKQIPVLILPELGEIMRSPARKRKSWDGLQALQRKLALIPKS